MAAVSSDDIVAQNRLVEESLPIVGYHVSEVLRRVPAHVDREELASAGAEALVRAARAFDPSLGVPFARYAATRIRGALIDELRSMDWISRGARTRVRAYSDMVDRLSGALGRKPSEEEVAEALGVGIAEVRMAREDAQRRTVSLDEEPLLYQNIGSTTAGPEDQLLASERVHYLNAAVDALPDKLRTVIVALYREDVAVKDLAERMGVTQSRISQLRTQALDMMRDAVNAALSPELAPTPEAVAGVAMRRRLAYYAEVAQSASARSRAPSPQVAS
ncbi:sigma-70 family RNA polymerase sigma factor [Actinomycetaceae bacterium L2_0104]